MFVSTLTVALLMLTFVGQYRCDQKQGPVNVVDTYSFIHPTFDMARKSDKEEPVLKLKPTSKAVKMQLDHSLVSYAEEAEPSGFDRAGSCETSIVNTDNNVYDVISYSLERRKLAQTIGKGRFEGLKNVEGCHRVITPRAFEIWLQGGEGTKQEFSALAIDQGTGVCRIDYRYHTVKRGMEFDDDSVKYSKSLWSFPMTRYKISSLWAHRESSLIRVRLIDEAGFVYYTNLDATSYNWTAVERVVSLSAVDLEDASNFKYETPFSQSYVLEDINKVSPMAIDNLKLHYKHAFVEAVTVTVDGSLCWSTGTSARRSMLQCFSPEGTNPALPLPYVAVSGSGEKKRSVRAIETYEWQSRYYLHAVYTIGSDMVTAADSYYIRCEVGSLEAMREITPSNKSVCRAKRMSNNLMPIDIVFMRDCNKVITFYQHMFTATDPGQSIETHNGNYLPIDWMNFNLNAVLYRNGRFYMFLSGNELLVAKVQGDYCTLKTIATEAAYPQSQMLLRFDDDLHPTRARRSELPPIYDGKIFSLGPSNWSAPLDLVEPIQAQHVIAVNPDSVPTPSNKTDIPVTPQPNVPPQPKPAGNSTSIVIVIVIVIIIIGIVCGSVYYFCFGEADEPVRRPKSALRKSLKTLGGSRSPPTPQVSTAPPSPAKLSQTGSSLTPTMTVRSGMNSPSYSGGAAASSGKRASKSAMKSTKSKSPLSDAFKTLATTKSRLMAKSKSRSRSPGPNSPKAKSPSKKSSPGTSVTAKKSSPAMPSASTLSKNSPGSPKSPSSAAPANSVK